MKNWLIIWAWLTGGAIQAYTYHRHLTTDPACKHYKAPKAGSRLDRWSRGLACNPCMVSAAFGDHECFPLTVDDDGRLLPTDDPEHHADRYSPDVLPDHPDGSQDA